MSTNEQRNNQGLRIGSDTPAAAKDSLRWWLKLVLQPVLFLVAGVILLTGLGVAQKLGWLAEGGDGHHQKAAADKNTLYICPMMCTPPLSEPGRCPVCGMELVPASAGIGKTDSNAVQIDPVARRLANIQTVAVKAVPFTRVIRAIGELNYDEGALKTISAYVDGRLDRLYANFTGVEVKKGDKLALLYSPLLYSGQVELLAAKRAGALGRSAPGDLYASARQKLLDLGMTKEQIDSVEKSGKANSRIHLHAPMSGTVIEKFAVEGQHVKEGQAIYRLADLANVWLMLKMFPEEAAALQNGAMVTAEVQSLPGRKFEGRVAFIDPMVDRKTRTVGVRVVMPNPDGLLRAGDYAKATIQIPSVKTLVVPRQAVLMAGDYSVVYVETKPGRFELRRVVLGPSSGEKIVLLQGIAVGEMVATAGNFLIDSQMQLSGNPSLIDPTRAKPKSQNKITEALAKLSEADRALAEQQVACPVTHLALGSMGTPIKVDVQGTTVFICCKACRENLLNEAKKHLAKIAADAKQKASQAKKSQKKSAEIAIAKALSKLPLADQALAERQRICPVGGEPLGMMGVPIKVDVQGRPVFICCEGCREALLAEPAKFLRKLSKEGGK